MTLKEAGQVVDRFNEIRSSIQKLLSEGRDVEARGFLIEAEDLPLEEARNVLIDYQSRLDRLHGPDPDCDFIDCFSEEHNLARGGNWNQAVRPEGNDT